MHRSRERRERIRSKVSWLGRMTDGVWGKPQTVVQGGCALISLKPIEGSAESPVIRLKYHHPAERWLDF